MILTHGSNSLPRGGGGMTVNIGGREYPVVQIGNQLWIAENLDFKFPGLVVGAGGTTSGEPRGNYYGNNEATYGVNGNKYGLLYNWIAVKYLENNKSSWLPTGWHVPTLDEYMALSTAVGGRENGGTKLKSTTGWKVGAGTDDYGFSAFPAGYYNDEFKELDSIAFFWTTVEDYSNAYSQMLDTGASINRRYSAKFNQYSVRLVKDA